MRKLEEFLRKDFEDFFYTVKYDPAVNIPSEDKEVDAESAISPTLK